jgi:epoxyqueuosine reductase
MTDARGEVRCGTPLPGHRPPPWGFLGAAAHRLGFAAIGVAPAGEADAAAIARYDDWLARGFGTGLAFAERWREVRRDLRHPGIVAGATAVVSAALPYGSGAARSGLWRHVAAHARGRDYHPTVRDRLALLAREIAARFPGARYRLFADTAPIAERAWAVSAHVGAIGANGALSVAGVGPRVVLGEIVLAAVPAVAPAGALPSAEPCTGCGACVAACPTGALREGGLVDCRACLSYHTIENTTGELPAEIRGEVRLVFGCDACTSACPRADAARERCALEPPPYLGPDDLDPEGIARMPDAELSRLLAGTCLERTGAAAIRRNAGLAAARAAHRAP